MSHKAQYAELEAFVEDTAAAWQHRMGLDHWEIEHVFLDTFLGDDGEEDFKITAVTESRWSYLEAKVKWYLPSAIRHSTEHLEQVVVHELCHVLLSPEQTPLADKYGDQLELATEMTSRALWRIWQDR